MLKILITQVPQNEVNFKLLVHIYLVILYIIDNKLSQFRVNKSESFLTTISFHNIS